MTTEEKNKKVLLLLEDLAALEGYVRDLFTFSPLPICFISPLGVILEVNPSFEKISGFNSDEIVGESIEKVLRREQAEALNKETLEKGFIEGIELTFFPRRGEIFSVQGFTKVRKDEKGRSVGYFLGIFNLSGIKKSEEDLKKAQTALLNILEDTEDARKRAEHEKNKTQTIITSFTDGLLLFDKMDRITMINPQAENFLKVESEEIIAKSISEMSHLGHFRKLMNILGKEIKEVFRRECKLSENFILEVSTISLPKIKDEVGTLVILHDISREKLIERLKTEFVSISAHQLRTPLSAIKWTLKMILDGDLGKITKEQKVYLEKTYRSNERMISLINSLLNVTRIEEGRFLYRPVLANIQVIASSVVESFRQEANRKNINLTFRRIKSAPEVLIDIEKIKLALQNLIDNAIRYTMSEGSVKVSLRKMKEKIEIRVQDTGVGIPEEQQGRVFSKFFRAANAMRLETEGSGLGLFIAKNIIEAHGGEIRFESEEGKGTTFYFSLPTKRKLEEFLGKP